MDATATYKLLSLPLPPHLLYGRGGSGAVLYAFWQGVQG